MQSEVWKTIPGIPACYEVSSLGRVRSLKQGERILKPAKYGRGYLMVAPVVDGRNSPRKVHHLVLLAFVGPRPDGAIACHANDIPDDNRPENLRWDTYSANADDRRRNGGYDFEFGERSKSARLTAAQALAIFHDKRRHKAIALEYSVSHHTVYSIKAGFYWSHVTGVKCRGRRAARTSA